MSKRRKGKTKYAMSRQGQKFLGLLIAAAIAVFVWADRSGKLNRLTVEATAPAADSNQSASDRAKYHLKTFTVVKVVDGDTLDLNLPDGKYKTTRIRLLGVDTPETKKPNTPVMYFGPEASERTKQLTLGKKVVVIIDTVSDERDRYGRLLGYIRLDDGQILNEVLVRDGYAYADLRFKHSDFDKYKAMMQEARKQKKGLWKDVHLKDMPGWMQKKESGNLKKAA